MKLSCWFKIGCYKFKIFYVSLIVITRENRVLITQKNIIKKSKHTDTRRHQNTQKRQQDKKQNNGSTKQPEIISLYLSIITLGAGSMAEWLSSRAPLQRPRVQILGADMELLVRPRWGGVPHPTTRRTCS